MALRKAPRDKESEQRLRESAGTSSSREGESMTNGWPSRSVGLALFALVLIILGGAFFLNDRLKPKVGIEPVVTGIVSVTATAIPTPISSPAQTIGGVAPPATVDSSTEKAAVIQAYLHYWDVYSNALLTLDTSHLSDAMAGDELVQARQVIDNLKAQHHAAKTEVDHHYAVVSLTQDTAVIQDKYLNRSYLVDATTKQPLQTPTSGQPETISCQLALQDGTWKVLKVIKINETITRQGS